MTTLVTGGTGYIGSHVTRLLVEAGKDVVVFDDVVGGVRDRIGDVRLVEGDLADASSIEAVRALVEEEGVDSVIHFAARKRVDESVRRPAWYYQQNVGGLAQLLLALEGTAVRSLIFSSSAAVYGQPEGSGLIPESGPTEPINPYGRSKLIGEQLLADVCSASDLKAVSLRYFNVGGAGWPDLGDTVVQNLVPMVFERLERGERPLIFGDDYPTPDGTCVRDFVHVADLADAHLAALDGLAELESAHTLFNVGTGVGASVREVIDTARRVTGLDLEPETAPRRAGDPAEVVADVSAIAEAIGWRSRRDLDDIVSSAWDAWTRRTR